MAEKILKGTEKGVVSIALNNPPLNILDIEMMRELEGAIEESSDAKIILIRAEGKAFCAGADVGEHLGNKVREMLQSFHGVFRAMDRVRGLTVAAVDGAALGGGCELATFCDLVLASSNSSFGQPESLVGVFPPVAAVLWPRIMGIKKATELIISGEKIDAKEAEDLGLVTRVLPSENFYSEVNRFLTSFKTKSLVVIEHAKRAVKTGARGRLLEALEAVESLYLDSLMKSHDAEEGLRAFLEKRKPQWEDR